MTLLKVLRDAVNAAKLTVLENLDVASEQTGYTNPYGDKTLWLDKEAERPAIMVLQNSSITFGILSEEQGLIMPEKNRKDLEEIPKKNIKDIKFHFVNDIDDVIQIAIMI